jgi:hypothetical protein
MLVAWRACNRKFELEFSENLAPDGRSVDLHFGGAVAQGMQSAREAYFVRGLPPAEAHNVGMNAALEYWAGFPSPEGHAKNGNSLLLALDGYFQQWPLGTDPLRAVMLGESKAAVEVTFAHPILEVEHPDGGPLVYAGRYDMLGEIEGVPYIVDEKTTGRGFSAGWSQSWTLRNQFIGYTWAAQQEGFAVSNVLVRGIAVLKTKLDFTQAIVTIPNHLISRWYSQLTRDLARMVEQFRSGYFDLNLGDTCSSYGNCPFIPVCSAISPQEWFSMYSERNWNPLKKNPTEKELVAA